MSADNAESAARPAGAMVRRSLSAGDPLRSGDVMRPGDHGFLSAVLEPGMRAVTVGVDAITGAAGLIWPGDRVDLILTQTIQEASMPMGHRVAAETVLSNVRVIAIDQQLVQGADSKQQRCAGPHRYPGSDATAGRARFRCDASWQLSLAVRSADASPRPATSPRRDRTPHGQWMSRRHSVPSPGANAKHHPRLLRLGSTPRSSSSDDNAAQYRPRGGADQRSRVHPRANPGCQRARSGK